MIMGEKSRLRRQLEARRRMERFREEHADSEDSAGVEDTVARERATACRAERKALGWETAVGCARWLAWKRLIEASGGKRPKRDAASQLEGELPELAKIVEAYVSEWRSARTPAQRGAAARRHLDPIASQIATRALAELRQNRLPKEQRLAELRAALQR